MSNEWLEYNLRPLLNSVISTLGDVKALLQTMTATAGSILTEGTVTLTAGLDIVVTYTNSSGAQQFISAVGATSKKTGIWELELPEGVGTKTLTIRSAHQTPNFGQQWTPGFPLPDGKSVTLRITGSSSGGTANGLIFVYKTS